MTDRDLTPGMAGALANARIIFFYEGEFTGGTLRLCSEPHTVSWDGKDWLGAGQLLSVSKVSETTDIRATSFSVELNPANSSIMAAALAQCRQGQRGTVWIGVWDAGNVIVGDPYLAYEGRLDVPEIVLAADTGSIKITYESRLIDLERPREIRLTHEQQQITSPGDLFFQYETSMQDKVITF